MKHWCVHGWRQQSTNREQILAWLAQARQLGFDRYSLVQHDGNYWLCCGNDGQFDVAAAVRAEIDEAAAVVVQQLNQQLLVVAWRQQTLLGCCEFSADKHGIQSFLYIAEQWLSAQAMNCRLVIAGQPALELLAAHRHRAKQCAEILLDAPPKAVQMRSIRQSPAWLRHRVIGRWVLVNMAVAGALSWWFWPQPQPPLAVHPITTAAPEITVSGWQATDLNLVSTRLAELSYLAGWQVVRWQLTPQHEQLEMQQTYGTRADLLAQLPTSNWQFTGIASANVLQRAPVPTSFATPMAMNDDQVAKLTAALQQHGYRLRQEQTHLRIDQSRFDPLSDNQWQAFLDWLGQQPNIRVTHMEATPVGFNWQLKIEAEQL